MYGMINFCNVFFAKFTCFERNVIQLELKSYAITILAVSGLGKSAGVSILRRMCAIYKYTLENKICMGPA